MVGSSRCHGPSSGSGDSGSSSDDGDDRQLSVAESTILLLAVLPWFESAAHYLSLSGNENSTGKPEDEDTAKRSFYTLFRCEATILRLRLDYAWSDGEGQLPSECFEILENTLDLLETLLSYEVLSLITIKLSRRSRYPRLKTLQTYHKFASADDSYLCRSYLLIQYGEREKDRDKLLKRITKRNTKFARLLDKYQHTAPLSRIPKIKRKAPPSEIRRLANVLYDTLSRHWSCGCPATHEAKFRLATHRDFNISDERIEFELLIGTNCMPTRWQESKFCVLVPKETPTHSTIKFVIQDDFDLRKKYPIYKQFDSICDPLRESRKSKSRLHVLVDNGNLFQIPSINNQNLIAYSQPSITLDTLLSAGTKFSRKQKGILAVLLAYSVLQFCESPWMERVWTKKNIWFFYGSTDILSADLRRPYLSTCFGKLESGEDTQAMHRIHRHSGILALGILLLELELGTTIESLRCAEDQNDQEVNVNTDYTTALRLLDQYDEDVCEDYKTAIQSCLECKFVTPGVTFEDDKFRRAICENIIEPLEDQLYAGFKISIQDLDELLDTPLVTRGKSPSPSGFPRTSISLKTNTIEPPSLKPSAYGFPQAPALNRISSPPLRCSERPLLNPKFSLFDDEWVDVTLTNSRRSDNWLKSFEDEVLPLVENSELEQNSRVRIAILDTGFDPRDAAILANRGRIVGLKSWVDGARADEDLVGHGTHTTALLLSVAPDANIYVARIARNGQLDNANNVAEAIRWATEECRVDIISMSFGFPRRIEAIQDAIKEAFAKDVIMLAAASNNGGNHGIAYPANQSSMVICINSTDGQGNCSKFSPTRHSQSENFAALGELVESSWPSHLGVGSTQRKSGTSFATPIAAGVAAVILQYARQKLPDYRYSDARLLRSCTGMRAVLKLMTEERGGYSYITPWKFLKRDNSQSYICETILMTLREI